MCSAGLVAAIALMGWHPAPTLLLAALAYIAAQSFYFAGVTIYESFLPDLLPAGQRQKLSGFGWSIGYLGGIFGIIVLLVLVGSAPQSRDLIEQCLVVIALISAVFYAVVLAFMRREGFAKLGEGGGSPRLQSVLGALLHWRSNRRVLFLLLGTMLVQLAVSVVVTFTAPILSDRFGQSLRDLLWLLLLIHIVAVPSTLAWNYVMVPGWRRTLTTALLLASWGLVLLLLAFGSGPWMPLVTVLVIGCCLGATASALRGFLAESASEANPVTLFALSTIAGRIAAAGGPALFSVASILAGEQAALLVILLVLVCGGGVILLYLRSDGRPAGEQTNPSPIS
jgi:UMF1 family MFS transporter